MAGANMPSIRHLRVFATVAELQSVRKAAEAVFLSQPAVTQAIAKVEAQVGANLFDRRSSGTYLSEAGHILASRTKRMFAQIEDALAEFGLPHSKGNAVDALAHRITRSHIRGFLAMANGASLADGLEERQVSQVSLSRAARDLERTLGSPLFHNSASGTTLLPAGIELAGKLTLAMKEVDWAVEEIRAAEGRVGGELRVGAMPLAGSFLLGPVLNQVAEHFPRAHIHVRTDNCANLTRALQLGEIDFVVGLNRSSANPNNIDREALFSSPYVIVARQGHPLTGQSRIKPTELEGYSWVVPSHSAVRRSVLDKLFASMTNPPVGNIEAYSPATMRTLLDGSDRLSLLTKFEFECERGAGVLAMLPYTAIHTVHTTGVSWRKNWSPTALHLTFLNLLRTQATKIAETEGLVNAA